MNEEFIEHMRLFKIENHHLAIPVQDAMKVCEMIIKNQQTKPSIQQRKQRRIPIKIDQPLCDKTKCEHQFQRIAVHQNHVIAKALPQELIIVEDEIKIEESNHAQVQVLQRNKHLTARERKQLKFELRQLIKQDQLDASAKEQLTIKFNITNKRLGFYKRACEQEDEELEISTLLNNISQQQNQAFNNIIDRQIADQQKDQTILELKDQLEELKVENKKLKKKNLILNNLTQELQQQLCCQKQKSKCQDESFSEEWSQKSQEESQVASENQYNQESTPQQIRQKKIADKSTVQVNKKK